MFKVIHPIYKRLYRPVFSKLCALLVILIVSTGCLSNAKSPAIPTSYQADIYDALRIDARRLEIIEDWQMPLSDPYVEHLLTPNLSSMIVEWASVSLVPVGGAGELILHINEASVQITELPKSTSIKNIFKDQQDVIVRSSIKGKLMWIHSVSGRQGILDLNSVATITIPESATPNERQMMVEETMIDAVNNLDRELRKNITSIEGILQ